MKKNEQALHEVISAHLSECKKYIEAEVYYKALAAIKNAKYADPRNIYIIALEKQVELLSDLSKKRPASDANKKEVRETIPEIIRRAIDDTSKREAMKSKKNQNDNENETSSDPMELERNLAMKKLKNQFVKLAEEFIDKGDYQSALEEIRRIFIVDPDNKTAKELEKKIQTLVSYHSTDDLEEPPESKKKRFSIGRVAPWAIVLLILGNIIVFYQTSMISGRDTEGDGFAYSSYSENMVTDSQTRASEEYQEMSDTESYSSQSSTTLPDAVTDYREVVPVADDTSEEDDEYEYTNDTTTLDESAIADLTVEESEAEAGSLTPRVTVDKPDITVQIQEPEYPAEALDLGIEGEVIIRVRYNASGTVNASFVESTDHPLLSDSALESARQSIFSPADTIILEEGEWVSIPYRFHLGR